MQEQKKWFRRSNISTGILFLLLLAIIFSPDVKGYVIQGLMKIGLFQPNVPASAQSGISIPEKAVYFKEMQGDTVNLSDLKGKVVFINFWATWCPPCIAEMPSINTLYAKYKNHKKIVFLMVDMDGKIEKSSAFMKKRKFDLPVFVPASEIPIQYFSGSLPTTLILNKEGNLVFKHMGGADYSHPEVSAFLDKLIQ